MTFGLKHGEVLEGEEKESEWGGGEPSRKKNVVVGTWRFKENTI